MALDIFGNVKRNSHSNEIARNTFYWPDNLKGENLVWRLPQNVAWNDNIVVREDECAVFYSDGKAISVFFNGPDRYALTTQNIPFLTTLGKAVLGIEQVGKFIISKRGSFEENLGHRFRILKISHLILKLNHLIFF